MGTENQLFILRHLQAKHCDPKHCAQPLYVCLVDFEKAFDKVRRVALWERLETLGLQGKLLNTIKSLYQQVTMKVKLNGKISAAFQNILGVKQGDPLSPALFGTFIEILPELIATMAEHLKYGNPPIDFIKSCPDLEGLALFYLLFADDLALITTDAELLGKFLEFLEAFCDKYDMKVNESKTEIIVFATTAQFNFMRTMGTHQPNFQYRGTKLQYRTDVKYLGMWFNNRGKRAKAVKAITEAGQRARFLLQNSIQKLGCMSPAWQIEIFNAIVRPVLSYGSQVWGVDY